MIEFIQGKLQTLGQNYLVIQAGGLGYRLFVPTNIFARLPALQEEVTIYTYLHLREDEVSLYGFLKLEDREAFTTLLLVSGVGPKLALAILSKLTTPELKRAIIYGETQSLLNISGVGKKTAQRIILELKDKLSKEESTLVLEPAQPGVAISAKTEALAALQALGYSLYEAERALSSVSQGAGNNSSVEELIKGALKALAKY